MITMFYYHVTVYKEVRPDKKQLELLLIKFPWKQSHLCYIPASVWAVILVALKNGTSTNVLDARHVVLKCQFFITRARFFLIL